MNPEALYRISYGMYIVSSHRNGEPNGQISNTVFQVSSSPVMIAVCLNRENLTNEFVRESKVFSVSVLEKNTPMEFIGRFGFRSGRNYSKFKDIDFFTGKTGAPIVRDHAVAYIEAEVRHEMETSTHTLFVGNVVDAGILSDADVMTYSYYRQELKGRAPKTATVYMGNLEG